MNLPRYTSDNPSTRPSVEDHAKDFDDELFGHYTLTKYFLAYIVSETIKDSEKGRELLSSPDRIVKEGKASKFTKIFSDLVATAIDDLEAEVSELKEEGTFDYKRDLKSLKWCRNMANKIKATYKKDVKRKKAVGIDELVKDL